jgi:hypothetical protein
MSRSEVIFEVVESPEGGYEAYALGDSIFTEAASLDELRKNVREAVRCHFYDQQSKPSIIRLHFVRDEVLSVEVAS